MGFLAYWTTSAISVCVSRYILQLRSVYLSTDVGESAGHLRSRISTLEFKISRAAENLGAPLRTGSHDIGGERSADDEGENDEAEVDVIIISDDPLTVGLGLQETTMGDV